MRSNLSFQVNGIQCGYEPAALRKLEGEPKTFVLLHIVSWETAYYPVNIDCQLNKTRGAKFKEQYRLFYRDLGGTEEFQGSV